MVFERGGASKLLGILSLDFHRPSSLYVNTKISMALTRKDRGDDGKHRFSWRNRLAQGDRSNLLIN